MQVALFTIACGITARTPQLWQPQTPGSDVDYMYFTVQEWLTGFYNPGAVCWLRGTDWILWIMQVKLVFRHVNKIAKSDY